MNSHESNHIVSGNLTSQCIQKNKNVIWRKSAFSLLFLLGLFPVGVVLMWLFAPWKKTIKISVTIIGVILFLPLTYFSIRVYLISNKLSDEKVVTQNMNQQSNATFNKLPTPTKPPSLFQKILVENCSNNSGDVLTKLPIKFPALVTKEVSCTSQGYIFVLVEKQKSFLTISDNYSTFCCYFPSPIAQTGRRIGYIGDTAIYLHTGIWGEGPYAGYRPIIVRGIRDIRLSNGEQLRLIYDKEVIPSTDSKLQSIENKYFVDDKEFHSGQKVQTPESVDIMLTDPYFYTLHNSETVHTISFFLNNVYSISSQESMTNEQWIWKSMGCGDHSPCSYTVCRATDPTACYTCKGILTSIDGGEKMPSRSENPMTTSSFHCVKM